MRGLLPQLRTVLQPRAQRHLVLAIIGSVLVALLDSVGVVLILPLVNLATGQSADSGVLGTISGLLGHPSTGHLTLILTGAVVALFVLKDVGSMIFAWWLAGFVNCERVRTSARILARMLDTPYTQVSMRSSAEMLRTADTAVLQVFAYTINGLMNTISSAISILALLLALLVVAPLPTAILVIYFGAAALAFDRIAKVRAKRAGAVLNDASLRGLQTALAALGAIKEIKLRGTQDHFVTNFHEAQLRGAQAGRTASFIASLPKYLLEILFIIAVGIVVIIGAGTGQGGGSAVGIIALFVGAGFRLLPSVTSLLANSSNIRVGGDSLRVVRKEMATAFTSAEDRRDASADGPALPLLHCLSLDSVTFRYPTATRDVLSDVTLAIPAGSTVALVGSSGSGKTTLADVVCGLHTPTSGRVTVDGHNIANNLRGWQRSIASVAQDVFLLDATLAENVAFDQSPEDIDRSRVLEVLAQAQLADVVESLPEGIDSEVGERGTRLSGGQRQRIGIARALYRQCHVLILDEATSALDNETEHRINQVIADLRGSATVLVIAHRLSTVRHADLVAFLDQGRVASVGTFEEVRASNASFARLVELGSLSQDSSSAGMNG